MEQKFPGVASIRDCAVHFGLYKPHARAQARVLLTQPVHREGRKTRTWLLEPEEIEALAERLKRETH